MGMISRSFRLEGSSWRKIGRSNISLLASELVSSEIAKVAAYERFSESVRVTADDYSGGYSCRRNKLRGWSFLVKTFSFRKRVGGAEDVSRGQGVEAAIKQPELAAVAAAEKKKKKSAWLPDPRRRWPVQGW